MADQKKFNSSEILGGIAASLVALPSAIAFGLIIYFGGRFSPFKFTGLLVFMSYNILFFISNIVQGSNLKILLESENLTEDDSFIDLSKARNSLGDIESQLNKLLNS
jgi:hypothetical protein